MVDETVLSERLAEVRGRMANAARKAGRAPEDVTLIAVTKTHSSEVVAAAARLGVTDVGENRVQEALGKITELRDSPLRWHLIGHLQSNKAKQAVQNFELIHSVDSAELATALNRQAEAAGKVQQILLQANVSGEESKFGLSPADVPRVADHVLLSCPALQISGYMTMAPLVEDPELAQPHFAALRQLSADMASRFESTPGYEARHLSMGMTGDFEVAIEEGATMVRIGSALFGAR